MEIVQHDEIWPHQLGLKRTKHNLFLLWGLPVTDFFLFVISFWMRGDKYVAFFLKEFSICPCKGLFVSANNLRMAKKLWEFWLLLISSLCHINTMHCLAQSMFTLKLVSAIFYQVFIFHQRKAFQKLKNVFCFILKVLFFLEIFKSLYFCLPVFFPCQPLPWRLIEEKCMTS